MSKIACFLPNLAGGGAERNIVNLANGLAARGHIVDLVLAQKTGPYLDIVASNVSVVDLDIGTTLLSFLKLAPYLKKNRPDAVIAALNQANVAAIVATKMYGLNIPVIIGIQNTLSSEAKNASGINLKLMPYFVKVFYPMADEMVCVSAGAADDLSTLANIPRNKISVIYNPVVTESLFEKASQPVNHPWFAPGEPPVILGVGRLNVQKDFPTLLKAFAIVRKSLSARLMILGEGEDRQKLTEMVAELSLGDSVALPGFVSNPYAYMSNARLFVLSSLYEGLPTVLIETLAVGCPVVATDCPSGPKEILKDGKYGPLVPVGDVHAIANAIISVLSAPKATPPKESWEPYLAASSVDKFEMLVPNSSRLVGTAVG